MTPDTAGSTNGPPPTRPPSFAPRVDEWHRPFDVAGVTSRCNRAVPGRLSVRLT